MGCFGGLVTRQSQRTKYGCAYLVHPEQDQSVRSMKLSLAAHSSGCVGFAEANQPKSIRGVQSKGAEEQSAGRFRSRRGKTGWH